MVRFLAKVILTLEPIITKDKFHESIREISAHHKGNLLNMIGVDPVVFRTESSRGEVDLQIWVTTITGSPLNRLVIPFYYVGARKYIFMCGSKNSVTFVSDALQLVKDKINALYEIMILCPINGDKKTHSRLKTKFRKLFADNNLENFSFHNWSEPNDLAAIFKDVVEDIVVNMPQDVGYVPVGFDLSTVENIARQQGFEVTDNHEVLAKLDDILFRINLQKNIVYAEKSDCINCPKECKVSKKLCIEIADKGFSTMKGLGDLRMVSILLAIKDGTILTIKGGKPQEDIEVQIAHLRETFEKTCKNKKK
ncbi:MAG: hypothetical protein HZR80_03015 [Candidatus Heimdallarchaeota archaeon]